VVDNNDEAVSKLLKYENTQEKFISGKIGVSTVVSR
jgi:hypothetical protein